MKEEGYMAPLKARYIAAASADGEPRLYPSDNVWFYDDIPLADDTKEGFRFSSHRWEILEETFTLPQWSATGRRTGTIIRKNGWRNIAAAIKNRTSASLPWDAELFVSGRFLQADFSSGVLFEAERYFAGRGNAPDTSFPSGSLSPYPPPVVSRHIEVEVFDNTIDECDYIVGERATITAYGLRPGSTQLYGQDGREYGSTTEVGLDSVQTTTRTVINKRPVTIQGGETPEGARTPTTITTGDRGGIPGAEICTPDSVEKDREQTFTVTVCLAEDDVTDNRKQVEFESVWVETQAEAEFWGRLELAILQSFDVPVTLSSPIPILDVGDTIAIDAPELGFLLTDLLKIWGSEISVEGGVEGVVTQELLCKRSPLI